MIIDRRLKRIGLTIGDPAGIGPELALRVANDWPRDSPAALLLVGDQGLMRRVARELELACPPVISEDGWEAFNDPIGLLSIGNLNALRVIPGHWSADTGAASYHWVRFCVQAALRGSLDAIVTGPIQKEAWQAAGIPFPGHTELLGELTATSDYRMMLTSPEISCVLVTTHLPLADVGGALTIDAVAQTIRLGAAAQTRAIHRLARVTVCGLNPHAGEHGMFSHDEEERIIAPAVERCRAEGLLVTGPLSPDTAFIPAQRAATDVYVCMYHDQGLIPLKAIAFEDAVNVTLGLPIVRTSVDHGTAMDIAWQGVASDASLRAAIKLAIELA